MLCVPHPQLSVCPSLPSLSVPPWLQNTEPNVLAVTKMFPAPTALPGVPRDRGGCWWPLRSTHSSFPRRGEEGTTIKTILEGWLGKLPLHGIVAEPGLAMGWAPAIGIPSPKTAAAGDTLGDSMPGHSLQGVTEGLEAGSSPGSCPLAREGSWPSQTSPWLLSPPPLSHQELPSYPSWGSASFHL